MLRPGNDKKLTILMPLGLAALVTTIFLIGVSIMFQPIVSWPPYWMYTLFFGSLIELLAGMWVFAYSEALATSQVRHPH